MLWISSTIKCDIIFIDDLSILTYRVLVNVFIWGIRKSSMFWLARINDDSFFRTRFIPLRIYSIAVIFVKNKYSSSTAATVFPRPRSWMQSSSFIRYDLPWPLLPRIKIFEFVLSSVRLSPQARCCRTCHDRYRSRFRRFFRSNSADTDSPHSMQEALAQTGFRTHYYLPKVPNFVKRSKPMSLWTLFFLLFIAFLP